MRLLFIISCPIDTTDKVIAEIINMTNAGAVCEKIDKKNMLILRRKRDEESN